MNSVTSSAFCTIQTIDELTCLHVKHPKFFAEICLQGAQLTQFKHHLLGDFVWLSPSAEYKRGQSLRGGIPICWPWFGIFDKNPQAIIQGVTGAQGSHGFARSQIWNILNIKESVHNVTIEMGLSENDETLSIWPHSFNLICRIQLGDELHIELINHNSGNEAFSLTQALHTYLGVSNIENITIQGGHNKCYIDALDNWQTKQQFNGIKVNKEVDRIYIGNIHYQFSDNMQTTTLNSNSQSSVVWNPWVNKSQLLSQFPTKAYQDMLCIENGNILDDAIHLQPNERHTLCMTLRKY